MPNIAMYTTPTCGYCKAAKAFFKEKGQTYTEYDITQDDARAEEAVRKSGQMGVPVIDIDGQIIVGFDQPKISQALGL
ncbi:MAG: glutathione S-transferase N-terminal domain-containing protein [Candidatus Kerfeldbacteria bacterium]|nr:glutathione S-transferase N-terminal domain-containing protein [Candidatus Kerfeldbacteria bacterium]